MTFTYKLLALNSHEYFEVVLRLWDALDCAALETLVGSFHWSNRISSTDTLSWISSTDTLSWISSTDTLSWISSTDTLSWISSTDTLSWISSDSKTKTLSRTVGGPHQEHLFNLGFKHPRLLDFLSLFFNFGALLFVRHCQFRQHFLQVWYASGFLF